MFSAWLSEMESLGHHQNRHQEQHRTTFIWWVRRVEQKALERKKGKNSYLEDIFML